jgi:hypothetical protein
MRFTSPQRLLAHGNARRLSAHGMHNGNIHRQKPQNHVEIDRNFVKYCQLAMNAVFVGAILGRFDTANQCAPDQRPYPK